MKKTVALILFIVFCFCFISCAEDKKKTDDTDKNSTQTAETSKDTAPTLKDESADGEEGESQTNSNASIPEGEFTDTESEKTDTQVPEDEATSATDSAVSAEGDLGDNEDSEGRLIRAEIEVEGYGVIKLVLDTTYTPITVDNFVNLANSGFYDGLTFHRIIEGFMIQGGDPNHNSTGGSGKNIKGEFELNNVKNPLSHKRGVISMARAYAYDSASSQFFIVHQDSEPSLDGKYAAFGWVTEGMEVVDAIVEAAQPIDANGTIPFEEQPVITRVTILDQL